MRFLFLILLVAFSSEAFAFRASGDAYWIGEEQESYGQDCRQVNTGGGYWVGKIYFPPTYTTECAPVKNSPYRFFSYARASGDTLQT